MATTDGAGPRRFVLLDRDGTVIEERHYLADPDGVALIPGAAHGLRALRRAGFGLVIVTNQAGIARGLLTLDTLARIHARMNDLLAIEDARVDGIYFCPHGPDDGCPCRKPRTGLVQTAAAEHGFEPRASFVVGDNAGDILLAKNLPATSILVRTGYGAAIAAAREPVADYEANDLASAAELIIRHARQPARG